MSNGMLGFQQCLKIQDTPFPFPYMQLCLIALAVFTVICGFFVHEFCKNPYWAFVFAFVAAAGFSAINEVAIQLEDPFGDDLNDLPLENYQQEFNQCLIQISFMDSKRYSVPKLENNIKNLYEQVAALGHDFDNEPALPAFQSNYQSIEAYCEADYPDLNLSWAPNTELEGLRRIAKQQKWSNGHQGALVR